MPNTYSRIVSWLFPTRIFFDVFIISSKCATFPVCVFIRYPISLLPGKESLADNFLQHHGYLAYLLTYLLHGAESFLRS